jgi:bacterioferritin (cytochrome b1)
MQATSLGPNLTGAALTPAALIAMNDASDQLTLEEEIDTSAMEAAKLAAMAEADAVGSMPPPSAIKGMVKSTLAQLKGGHPIIFMDKIGERIAFERTGTRLYDALIVKYRAAVEDNAGALPSQLPADGNGSLAITGNPGDVLIRIRAQELEHFSLLCEAMLQLGGDPTAQTPCADVIAVASGGLMQVLNDPRTTLAQCLNAMLTAELTDNAGWELLIRLAEHAGESELAGRFQRAFLQEQEHLAIVKGWLTALVSERPQPALV